MFLTTSGISILNGLSKLNTVDSRLAKHPPFKKRYIFLTKTSINCFAVSLAITDYRYYGIADTVRGPQQVFLHIT